MSVSEPALLQTLEVDLPSVEAKICDIVLSVLNVSPGVVIPTARFREDLGADSLDMVEMIIALSHEIDIQIHDEDVCNISTVGEATAYVCQALASQDSL